MNTKFFCPHCKGILSVNNQIVFTVKKGSKQGLLFLSPHLGDYSVWHHPEFHMQEGEIFNFHCPICMADLSVRGHNNLAALRMEEDGKSYTVVFSQVKGEHCTYKISEGSIEASFGEHFANYVDFVSASMLK